ncbi:hypothetical protein [Deinococcus apachensis]|uniref:hypothetical protein n=1 Tax=Deinococcus apachensis TaxID=309886 RepID=UPI00037F6D93|nr:hypothetical protein [Deinococcus apachensis]
MPSHRRSGSWAIDALTLARTRAAHLRQLAETLSPIFDPLLVVDTLLRPFSPLFPTARGSVSLLDWDQMVVEQVRPLGEADVQFEVAPRCSLSTQHPWCLAAGTGQALFTSRGQDLPPLLAPAHPVEPPDAPFALAVVPLPGRQRAHGMLTLERPASTPSTTTSRPSCSPWPRWRGRRSIARS